MIIAIYGPSRVGKTTVSSRVATELNLPLRSCGRAVRDRAKSLGLVLDAVPDAIHRAIDKETLAWALTHQPCVIEGRFLDAVLSEVDCPILFIRLTASDLQRRKRACISVGPGTTIDDLMRIDADDARFVERMFTASGVAVPCVTVDTSDATVEECTLRIKDIITAQSPRRP